jgi:hypothetical protein
MATVNNQTTDLQVSGVGHVVTNVAFAPNAGSDPVASTLKGAYTSTVTRSGAGTYLVTLRGFSPKALVGVSAYAFDNANPTDTACRVGLVTITPTTKTVTLVVYTNSALAAPALKDIAANAASTVKLVLTWKLFSGVDVSGL